MGFIVVVLEILFTKGNFSIPLSSMGWEGCLGQGSLLSLRARRGSPLGSLWDHGWEARKETVQLVPHLLWFWWKVLGLQNQYSPPLWLGNPPGFSSPNLYPVIAPLPQQRSPCHSRFCRLAHGKGRSRLPSLGPRSPRRPASYFPPPACSIWRQCLGKCVISPARDPSASRVLLGNELYGPSPGSIWRLQQLFLLPCFLQGCH